jgi:hypothetical protein
LLKKFGPIYSLNQTKDDIFSYVRIPKKSSESLDLEVTGYVENEKFMLKVKLKGDKKFRIKECKNFTKPQLEKISDHLKTPRGKISDMCKFIKQKFIL